MNRRTTLQKTQREDIDQSRSVQFVNQSSFYFPSSETTGEPQHKAKQTFFGRIKESYRSTVNGIIKISSFVNSTLTSINLCVVTGEPYEKAKQTFPPANQRGKKEKE
jgi:hypothetical protein